MLPIIVIWHITHDETIAGVFNQWEELNALLDRTEL
jgi:hypothetical protein